MPFGVIGSSLMGWSWCRSQGPRAVLRVRREREVEVAEREELFKEDEEATSQPHRRRYARTEPRDRPHP
eukprot:6810982-Prymnesium_polylepis.1